MRVHLENLEVRIFEKFNKYHGKWYETWKNLVATNNSPLKQYEIDQITGIERNVH